MSNAKRNIIIITFIIVITVIPSSVFAQAPGLDLTVSPVFFDYAAKPGDTIKDKIRIRNNTSAPIPLKIEIQKIGPDKNGALAIQEPKPDDVHLGWIKFDSATVSARPKEWSDINFTLSIPQDAAFGYYMAISVKSDGQATTGNTAAVTGEAAIPILLNVKKDGAKVEGKLTEFKPKNFINEYLPVEFDLSVANTGNVHIRPRGNIFLSGPGIKDLGLLDVNADLGAVLPGATRFFTSKWTDGFLTSDDGHLNAHWDKLTHFRIGPYNASILLVFDNGTRDVTLDGKTTFWILPYKLIGLTLGVILAIIFITRWLLKAYVKAQIKKQKVVE